ncbi:MAG: biotin/lipoyl-binding protein, partial [Phycisphaerae bacterium]|nr:biotin/lipoyl-binding protein [Phycisphaerae bacterium]
GGVITWACVPAFKLFKYLTIEPELHRKRGRAWAFTLSVISAIVLLIGIIPFNVSVHAEGIVNPREERYVFAESSGFVRELKARDGQVVRKGDVLLIMEDDFLNAQIEETRARLAAAELRVRALLATNPAQAAIEQQEMKVYRAQLEDALRRKDRLTIRAPIDGEFISPQFHELPGRFLPGGQQPIGVIRQLDEVVIKAALTQQEVALVAKANGQGDARVRLIGDFDQVLHATGYKLIQASQERIDPQLTHVGGGQIAPDPQDPSGQKPLQEQFDLRVELSNPRGNYVVGQRAFVKITLDQKPLIWQWWRRLLQLIQSSSGG